MARDGSTEEAASVREHTQSLNASEATCFGFYADDAGAGMWFGLSLHAKLFETLRTEMVATCDIGRTQRDRRSRLCDCGVVRVDPALDHQNLVIRPIEQNSCLPFAQPANNCVHQTGPLSRQGELQFHRLAYRRKSVQPQAHTTFADISAHHIKFALAQAQMHRHFQRYAFLSVRREVRSSRAQQQPSNGQDRRDCEAEQDCGQDCLLQNLASSELRRFYLLFALHAR
jgi:hypothetical protein